MLPTDLERILILQVAAGNEQAFAELFNAYRPNIYSTARRMTGDTALSEEIVQDTFLKVWIKRETLPEIQHFPGWLYAIAQNFCYTAIRKMKREKFHSALPVDALETISYASATDDLSEREYEQVLNRAILRLPVKQQQTYRLVKEQGLQRDEVARMLRVSPETVKTNLSLAVRSIRAFCVANLDLAMLSMLLLLPYLG